MTINLPHELESSVQAAVMTGRFASVDDAMAEAVRLLLREMRPDQPARPAAKADDATSDPVLGSIGAMRHAADELDEIVAEAMKKRQEPWRVIAGE